MNLIELDASENGKISNVNHMTKLKVLSACGSDHGIDNDGIRRLNLEELNVDRNTKITNINHLINLKILNAAKCRPIDGICIGGPKNVD